MHAVGASWRCSSTKPPGHQRRTCCIVHVALWVDGAPEQGVQQVVLNIHLQPQSHNAKQAQLTVRPLLYPQQVHLYWRLHHTLPQSVKAVAAVHTPVGCTRQLPTTHCSCSSCSLAFVVLPSAGLMNSQSWPCRCRLLLLGARWPQSPPWPSAAQQHCGNMWSDDQTGTAQHSVTPARPRVPPCAWSGPAWHLKPLSALTTGCQHKWGRAFDDICCQHLMSLPASTSPVHVIVLLC